MTTRFYSLTECVHGSKGICDHIPNATRGCMRLDCDVIHYEVCPGGQRRELALGRLLDAVDLMYDDHGEFVAGSGDWDELFDAALEIRAALEDR